MISQETIDRVREIPIEDVVAIHVKLKKAGSGYTGCCPFHDEKTPSFHVTPAKGLYKCFGCGKGGNSPISFIEEKENKSFPEAVELLAQRFNISVEYENDTRDKEQVAREKDEKGAAGKLLQATQNVFTKKLFENTSESNEAHKYLLSYRQLSAETIAEWGIGYSSTDERLITGKVIAANQLPLANKIGLAKEKEGKVSDTHKNRITIPITDHNGQLVGFGGRKLPWDPYKEKPKYINPAESFLYNKSKILFGLDKAAKAIRAQDFVILVEGYFDVIRMHQNGFNYTVATCGTALTLEQCKLLSRYTKNILILRDGDTAGNKATRRDIPLLKYFNFNIYTAKLPHGQDPDSFSNSSAFVGWLVQNVQEGIDFEIENAAYEFQFSAEERLEAFAKIIAGIKNATKREFRLEKLTKEYKLTPKVIKAAVKRILDNSEDDEETKDLSEKEVNQKLAHLKWLSKKKKEEAFFGDGFTTCEEPNDFGYWFGSPGFNIERMSNFIIRPLFSVNEPLEKFELAEIINKHGSTILEIPAGGFTSMDKFETLIWQARAVVMGKFGKDQLRLLNAKNIFLFKQATLVRTLGMQPEGFWSYADAIFYKNKIVKYDKTGIAQLDNVSFYSPGAAEHNRNKRKDEFGQEVTEGDPYRNDKFLNYTAGSVNFEQWSQQMVKVFGSKAMNAIATVLLAVNKDIVTSFEKLPIPYGFGDAESGKSVWGERIFYFFFSHEAKPFNLNSGTVFGFFNTLERFKNCPYLFNEFDEDNINEEFFRAFKQAHDGEGRNKGLVGSNVKNKSTEQPINVVPVLIGQILSTKDGGSVLSRCVPEKFVARTYSDEEKGNLDELKRWERKGMNGAICELLAHRAEFRKDFFPVFNTILSRMKTDITKDGAVYKERIARNHCILLTLVELAQRHFSLGFDFETYYSHMLGSVVNLTEMVNESNNLGVFWKEVVFMFEQQTIEEGFDYKIVTESEIKVQVMQNGRKTEIVKKFEEPKKLLMLRLSSIFPMFEQRIKLSSGNKSINQKTLITYFESNKAYIGNNQTSHFSSTRRNIKGLKTSSFVFDYEMLGLHLERSGAEADDQKKETITGKIVKHPEKIKIAEETFIKFLMVHYTFSGTPPKATPVYTTCFVSWNNDPGVMLDDTVTATGFVTETEGFAKKINRSMQITELKQGEAKVEEPATGGQDEIPDFDFPA